MKYFLLFNLVLLLSSCNKSSGGSTTTTTTTTSLAFKVYSATSSSGPWTSSTVSVTGSDAAGLVDPSPILMADNSILVYYLASYSSGVDPASSQPNNQWKMGVAKSTDNGGTFAHQSNVYTFTSSATDPFPMKLASGNIRLLVSQGSNVVSVTASDSTGVTYPTTLDSGNRSSSGGVPGALKIGSTYYIYVCSGGSINYMTSTDGLTFSAGGTAITNSGAQLVCDPSPIDNGGGNYLMAYKKLPTGGTSPKDDQIWMASSTNGTTWTTIGQVGAGSVPGLVKTATGTYLIFAPNQ